MYLYFPLSLFVSIFAVNRETLDVLSLRATTATCSPIIILCIVVLQRRAKHFFLYLYVQCMYIPYIYLYTYVYTPKYTLHTLIVYMGMGPNGPKRPIFDPKCQFLAKLRHFWAKNPIVWGREKIFWHPHIGEPMRHLFCVKNIDQCSSNWPLVTKMCNFDLKIWVFGAQSQFFVLE